MAGCQDNTCSCKVVAGNGVTVTGSGSPGNPYTVSADSAGLAQSFKVNDTPTVNLSLFGSGTPEQPFTLQAEATIKLTQLGDVQDPEGGPAVGESPVWVGVGADGHWEFKTPPPAPAGAVNVSYGIQGVGSALDPIHVKVLSNGVAGSPAGLEVYVDTAGNLRAVAPVATAVDWSTITGKPSVFAPAAHDQDSSTILNPQNFTGARSVGNSLRTNGVKISVSTSATASPPTTGNTAGDLFFRKAA